MLKVMVKPIKRSDDFRYTRLSDLVDMYSLELSTDFHGVPRSAIVLVTREYVQARDNNPHFLVELEVYLADEKALNDGPYLLPSAKRVMEVSHKINIKQVNGQCISWRDGVTGLSTGRGGFVVRVGY